MYHTSRRYAYWLAVVSLVTVILVTVAMIPISTADLGIRLARSLCLIVGLFIISELFLSVASYGNTEHKVDAVVSQIDKMKTQNRYPLPECVLLLRDYNSSIEAAPTFFPWVLRKHARAFREGYRKSYAVNRTGA